MRSVHVRKKSALAVAALATVALHRSSFAQTPAIWTNGGGDEIWTDAGNWNIDQVPNNSASNSYTASIGAPAPTLLNLDITVNSATIESSGILQSTQQFTLATVSGGSIANAGLVDPDGNVLALSASTITNTGTLETTDGGTLNLTAPDTNGLSITNIGGTIAALGTSSVVNVGGSVSGGLFTTTGGGAITLASGTISNVLTTTGSQISIDGTSEEALSGTLTNNGTFTLGLIFFTGGSLNVPAGATINGTGTLVMDKGSIPIPSGTLTFGSSQTVQGYGTIDGNVDNQNLIDANSSGSEMSIENGSLTNDGTLEATAGGDLQLTSNSIANMTGTIAAIGTSSTVGISSSVIGGLIASSSGGAITFGGGTLDNVTIAQGSQLSASSEAIVTVLGTLNNGGTFTLNQANSLGATLDFPDGGTLAGSGEINSQDGSISVDTGTLTIQSPQTIAGYGNIYGNVDNESIIDANSSGHALSFANGTLTNSSLIESTGGGTLNINNAMVNNAGGTIAAVGTGSQLNLSTNVIGGLLSASGGAAIYITGGTLSNVTIGSGSPVSIYGNDTEAINGTLTNNGAITLDTIAGLYGATLYFPTGGTLNGDGSVVIGAGEGIGSGSGTVTIGSQQTVEGVGQLSGSFVNDGTILANTSGGTLSINGSLTNYGTVQATNGGAIQLGSSYVSTGTLSGGTYEVDASSAINVGGASITTNDASVVLNGSTANFAGLSSITSNAGTLTLENGNTLATSGGLSNSGTINIDATSTLTVNGDYTQTAAGFASVNHEMLINYGAGADPISAIASLLATGYAGGKWDGTGIASSDVASLDASQSKLVYSLGYADGADGIAAGISSGQIEILATLAGDAKLQGNVVFGDFQLLAQYFGKPGGWDEGNFTYGPTVDFGDFQLLAQDFGSTSAGLSAGEIASLNSFAAQFGDQLVANADGTGFSVVAVPEPASAALAAAGLALLVRRRRRVG